MGCVELEKEAPYTGTSSTVGSESSVSKYLRDISKYNVLTPEEEKRLFYEYANGSTKAKEKIYVSNLKLVIMVAKKFKRVTQNMDFMDLVMEGNIGLNTAIENFDVTRGYKFSTYATWWIKQGIFRSISNSERIIRLPVHICEDISRIKTFQKQYRAEYGDVCISDELISDNTGISLTRTKSALYYMSMKSALSLDEPVKDFHEESAMTLGACIKDENASDSYTDVEINEMREKVEKIIENLSERDKMIFKRRFGWDTGVTETLDAIGNDYGVTRERIRQIEIKIIKEFRKPQNQRVLKEYLECFN